MPIGKIIVITGGSSGVGKALFELLSRQNTVIQLSRSVGDTDSSIGCDVSNLNNVKSAFAQILARHKTIDILINCAGVGLSGATAFIEESCLQKVFDINYFGTLYTCQLALQSMTKGAKILNIGSVSGFAPMPFRAIYNSSKAAVHSLSHSIRMEAALLGIDVSAIMLGAVATNFAQNRDKLCHYDTRYGDGVWAVDNFVEKLGNKNKMPTDTAAKKIIKILNKKSMKASYLLSIKDKIIYFLSFVFPTLSLKLSYKLMSKDLQK